MPIISVGYEIIKSLSWISSHIGEFKPHSQFEHVSNFYHPETLMFLSVVDESVGAGPYNIVYSSKVFLNESPYIWEASLLFHNLNLEKAYAKVGAFKDFIRCYAPSSSLVYLLEEDEKKEKNENKRSFENALKNKLKLGKSLIQKRKILEGISLMKGSGIGLTPSGDDFIAGFIWGLHFRKISGYKKLIEEIYKISRSKNLLVDHFLFLSKEALISEKQYKAFKGVCEGKYHPDLFDWGESSGFDFAVGLFFGLEYF